MLDKPEKFKHLDRFLGGLDPKQQVKMNLLPDDLNKYLDLQK